MHRMTAAAAAALMIAGTAHGQGLFGGTVYGEGQVGYTFERDLDYGVGNFDVDGDINGGIALGLSDAVPNFDFELDVFFTTGDYDGFTSSIDSTSVMANALYNFAPATWRSELYAGAGIGAIDVDYDGGSSFPAFSDSDWVFGWQLMAGARTPLGDSGLEGFAEYRYQDADDATLAGVSVEYHSHSIGAGLRYNFTQ